MSDTLRTGKILTKAQAEGRKTPDEIHDEIILALDDELEIVPVEAKRRWRNAFILLCFRYWLDGIEYSIVLPTLYDYLKNYYGAGVSYLGVVMACYSVGGLLAAPILGYISDMMGSGRVVLIVGALIACSGNVLYALAPIKQWVAAGRFLSGISGDPIVLSEIGRAKYLTEQDRSDYVSKLMIFRQLGIFTGPLIVIPIIQLYHGHFNIFTATISRLNVGAIGCGVLYIISAISFMTIYDPEISNSARVMKKKRRESESSEIIKPLTFKQVMLKEQVIMALFGSYAVFFQQSTLEAIVMALTRYLFNWTPVQLSLLLIFVSIEGVLAYITTLYTKPLLGGRHGNLLTGIIASIITLIMMEVYSVYVHPGAYWAKYGFIIFVVIYTFFIPYILTATAAIIATDVPKYWQGRIQSVRTTVVNIAMALAPLFSTNLFQNYGFSTVWHAPLVHAVIMLIMVGFSWKKIARELK